MDVGAAGIRSADDDLTVRRGMMPSATAINQQFFELLTSADPALQQTAINAINDYTRMQLRLPFTGLLRWPRAT